MQHTIKSSKAELAWEAQYVKLVAHKKQHGHCFVSKKGPDLQLASWVATQRAKKRDGVLSDDRLIKLNKIGFAWKVFESQWDREYDKLFAYYQKEGHCQVSKNDHDNELAAWIQKQRKAKSCGELTIQQQRKLSAIGFPWQEKDAIWKTQPERMIWNQKAQKALQVQKVKTKLVNSVDKLKYKKRTWDEWYEKLLVYRAEHGHCLVPRRDPEHKKLGTWVADQRQRKKHGTLTQDRVEKLEAVGFAWSARKEKNNQ